ncbi:hypothetical protein ACFPRA_01240 [Sporosarcina soli]|uniref:Uncharacterized protein n=1 Tax=Sporosarcina soli TaxID=334736 RepID=A0ABW0TDL3_9BACL
MKLRKIFAKTKPNKEFLIALTSLLVSIVTVFIMVATNKIMNTTNKIMETQIEVEKADKIPIINFEASYRENQNGFAVGEIITIHNEGGIMTDFNSEEITYIEIEILDYSRVNEQIKIKIPINDYYSVKFATGALKKKIITYDNFSHKDGNNKKRFDVINNFMDLMEPYSEQKSKELGKAFSIGVPEFKTYFYVEYTDIFNQTYNTYYEVDHFGAKKINDESTGEELFSADLSQSVSLEDINENMLLDILKKRLELDR